MKNKKSRLGVLRLAIVFGLAFLVNFGCFALSADLLHDTNVGDDEERSFTLDSYTDVYNVSQSTGITSPGTMSVIGTVSDDGSQYATIDYQNGYYGFLVNNDVVLNLSNVLIKRAAKGLSGSVVNNSGTLSINNVKFLSNVANGSSIYGGAIYNSGTITSILNSDFTGNVSRSPSGLAMGGAIYNEGSIGNITASFTENAASARSAYGGAIYNGGTITSVSGDFIDNYAAGTTDAKGGAIYTLTDMALRANGQDFRISGNYASVNGVKTYQAIYVGDDAATLTISANNGGSWTIDDIIDGYNRIVGETYYRYKLNVTGDLTSFVKFGNDVRNADVKIQDINVIISPDTFKTSTVEYNGTSLTSMIDNSTSVYEFGQMDSTGTNNAYFEFDINGADSDMVRNTGIVSSAEITVYYLNFMEGEVREGSYKLLESVTSNVTLKLMSGKQYSFTNVTPTLNWQYPVYSYTYDLALYNSMGEGWPDFYDTVIVSNKGPAVLEDNLRALNMYSTTYVRTYNFDSVNDVLNVSDNTGVTANLSSLTINGFADAEGNYTTINYGNTYKGFEMGVGASVIVNNIYFTGATTQDNGSVFNVVNSNASIDYKNGKIENNHSDGNGGAIYVSGNSFLNLKDVDFSNNTAGSGGAIYVYSNGEATPYVTNITGDFTGNSAAVNGGAIANVSDFSSGAKRPLISTIVSQFSNNTVVSDTDAKGGAIYNTGDITSVTGDFTNNSVTSTSGNAFGGAIYSGYGMYGDNYSRGAISKLTSSFIGNSVTADGVGYGGAIYTANSMTFNVDGSMTIQGNTVTDSNGTRPNAIFVDTTSGNATLNFSFTDGAVLNIYDEIDGGKYSDGVVTRGVGTAYGLNIQGNNANEKVYLHDVVQGDEVIPGIVNANIVISGVDLTAGSKTFAGENNFLNISSSTFNAKDNEYKEYRVSRLLSSSTVDYNMDFRAYVTQDESGEDYVKIDTDSFSVGANSSGTIRLTDINLNRNEFFEAAHFLEESSRDAKSGGFIVVPILKRDVATSVIYLEKDFDILDNPEVKTVADYYDSDNNKYVVEDTTFIGEVGFKLNDTLDSFIIGVLTREDQLGQLNRFDPGYATTREFNLVNHDDYIATEDLGVTSAGILTVNGHNRLIDFATKTGFVLDNSDVTLNINNVTITNSHAVIESNVTGLGSAYNVTLENVIMRGNDVAISNIAGNVSIKNSIFRVDNKLNTIKNNENGYINITSSTICNNIDNNGVIDFLGTNILGDVDNDILISGKGYINITDSAVSTDMRYVQITNPEGGVYNTVTFDNGTLRIGSSTLASAEFIASGGVVDLSGSTEPSPGFDGKKLGTIDVPYNIGKYTYDMASHSNPTQFIIDVDFRELKSDIITLTAADVKNRESETDIPWVYISQINGLETLLPTVEEGNIVVLNAPDEVELAITLEKRKFPFYVNTYTVEDRGFVLYDDYFVGEVWLQEFLINDKARGIEVKKVPIYDGIVELNNFMSYKDEYGPIDYSMDRYFIVGKVREHGDEKGTSAVDPEHPYKVPTNIGKTYPGKYSIVAYEGVTESGQIAIMEMQEYGGFEIINDSHVELTIDGMKIQNARTYSRYEYPESYSHVEPTTTTYRGINPDGSINEEQRKGSVIYMNSTDKTTKATIIDSVITNNTAQSLGGAIYTTNDLTIVAKNIDTQFTDNVQNEYGIVDIDFPGYEPEDPHKGTPNDIYLGYVGEQTLNLLAYPERNLVLDSGLEVVKGNKLILNVNYNPASNVVYSGRVKVSMPKDIGSVSNPIKSVIIGGGTFDTNDGVCTTIYTSTLSVTNDTIFNLDIDAKRGKSDKIWTDKLRVNQGGHKLLIAKENLNFIDGFDVAATKIQVLDIRSDTENFLTFIDDDGEYTNGLSLGTVAGVKYYAKIGLKGAIIVGTEPDCSDEVLVQDILSPKNKTYNLKQNLVLFNYGELQYYGKVNSKKLTIKGDSYSTISTPNSIHGFLIEGTDKLKPSKQQLVASKFDMKGFDGAFINRGGKMTLTNVNLHNNETDGDGAIIQNFSGTFILKGSKKKPTHVYSNYTVNNGAIYNEGTLTLKYVNFGEKGANAAFNASSVYSIGKATISNTVFTNNEVDNDGGAVYLGGYSKLTSDNFTSNTALHNGGAIYINAPVDKNKAVTVSKNNFYYNHAAEGGAVYAQEGKITVASSNFGSASNIGNDAENGGAVYNKASAAVIKSSKFAQNTATENGGAIYNEGTLTLKNDTFGLTDKSGNIYTNTAENGGIIYNNGTLTDNTSKLLYGEAEKGGAVYNDGTIASYNSKGTLTGGLNSSKLKINHAEDGGAIYNSGILGTSSAAFVSNRADNNGGAVYNSLTGNATFISSTFTNNTAGNDGGAIYNSGIVTLKKSTIGKSKAGNSAVNGGAVYNAGTLNSTGSTIAYNTATGNGAVYNSGTANLLSTSLTSNSADKGGAVYNTGIVTTDYKTKFTSNKAASEGGAIYNDSDFVVTLNGGTYSKNNAQSGGAIYNDSGDELIIDRYDYTYKEGKKTKHKYYNTSFSSNTAVNGGAIYNNSDLTVNYAKFSSNSVNNNAAHLDYDSRSQSGKGGAVYNEGTNLTLDSTQFSSNKAVTTLTDVVETPSADGLKTITDTTVRYGGSGGALYNTGHATVSSSTFTSNKAGEMGGAIATVSDMDIVGSTFTSNTTLNKQTVKEYTTVNATGKKSKEKTLSSTYDTNTKGGAIYAGNGVNLNITGSKFDKNSSYNGGAIFADKNSDVRIVDTNFTNNTAKGLGGAIYADEGSKVYVIANNQNVVFKNNKAGSVANDIYLNKATLYLSANNNRVIKILGDITGNNASESNVYEHGNITIAKTATLSGVTVHAWDGVLNIANESAFHNVVLNMNGTSALSVANNSIGTLSLKSLNLNNNASNNVSLDMDLKSASSDKIKAESVQGSGVLNAANVNLISNSKTPVSVKVGEGSEIKTMTATKAETAEATYKLKASLDANGNLVATAYGQKAKPCTMAAPVAAQLGGYLTQINSYDQAFMNMDINMTKTLEERKAESLRNKFAYAGDDYSFTPDNGVNRNGKGLWTRPYVTFERVGLSHGPKVGNIAYGNFFGGDADLKELNNGWKRQFSAYIGYNGSTQDFDRQSVDQNGGTLGVTEVWYKGNFFTGLTANAGANAVNASTDLGHENFPMLMAGVASKTGYNFEFFKGKFIVQPSILLSYSFVHTFSHKNGKGSHVGSSPLHAVQVAPGLKFIGNLPKGWQPYVGINMRWNIIDKTHFSLQDVSIPDMSIRPYVEYGVGLQRKWGERFTGFGQAMIRNGGRNGIMLSFGFKWAIGK